MKQGIGMSEAARALGIAPALVKEQLFAAESRGEAELLVDSMLEVIIVPVLTDNGCVSYLKLCVCSFRAFMPR